MRIIPLFVLALLPALAGCVAHTPLRLQYDPNTDSRPFAGARRPSVFVGEVTDASGGVSAYQGDFKIDRPLADSVKEALGVELKRLALPPAASPSEAEAVVSASVVKAEVVFAGTEGWSDVAEGHLNLDLTVRDRAGKVVLTRTIAGKGKALRPGVGLPYAAFNAALNAALAHAMSKLGPVLEAEDLVALVDGRSPERRQAYEAPADAVVGSVPVRGKSKKASYAKEKESLEEPPEEASPAPAPRSIPRPRTLRSDVDELPAPAARHPRSHALVIGVETYRESLPKADYAAGDAKLVAEYARRVLGVPEENVAVLTDGHATRGDFEKYFERWLPNRVEAGDEVLVYFSGHGAPNPKTGDAFLVPYDGDPTYIDQTGYPLTKLYAQLAKLPAKKVTVVMDSCFSGAGGRSVIAKGARPLVAVQTAAVPAKVTVVSASAGDQISSSYDEKGHGLFTYFFLKGLKEKGGDLRQVYEYLRPEVVRVARRQFNADQEPQWREGR